MARPKYFQIYTDTKRQIGMLDDAEAGRLLKALYNFAESGELPDFSNDRILEMTFSFLSAQIERDFEKYKTKVENGKKGGAPKGNQNASKDKTTENNLNNQEKEEEKNEYKDEYKEKEKEKEEKPKRGKRKGKNQTVKRSYNIDELDKFEPLDFID